MYLDLSNKNLTSLIGLVPPGIKILNCVNNQLTSLEGCPNSVTELDCRGNKNLDLFFIPNDLKFLRHDSQLEEYEEKGLEEIKTFIFLKISSNRTKSSRNIIED